MKISNVFPPSAVDRISMTGCTALKYSLRLSIHRLLFILGYIHDIQDTTIQYRVKGSWQLVYLLLLLPMLRNYHRCCVCQESAGKVCQHPQCQYVPFHYGGPCEKNASQIMHTHNKVREWITYQEFQEKVSFTRLSLDPYVLHKQFLGDMKKKIILAKDHLQEQIHCLDKAYEQLQRYLCVDLQVRLTAKNQAVMDMIEDDFSGQSLTGRDLKRLFSGEKSEEEEKTLSSIERLKEGFVKGLEIIDEIDVETMLINVENMFMSQREKKNVLHNHSDCEKRIKILSAENERLNNSLKIKSNECVDWQNKFIAQKDETLAIRQAYKIAYNQNFEYKQIIQNYESKQTDDPFKTKVLKMQIQRLNITIKQLKSYNKLLKQENYDLHNNSDNIKMIKIAMNEIEIERLNASQEQLEQEILELRKRFVDQGALEKKINQHLVLFVMLFAEIESLRNRVDAKEKGAVQFRRSSLAPFRS